MMIKMPVGTKEYELDGVEMKMDTESFVNTDDRTMVPARFVAEAMGFTVLWDNDTKTVTIYDRKKYFDTVDGCAFDFAMHWNAMSIATFKEIGAIIYQNDNGYYWDDIHTSKVDDKEISWSIPQVKKGVAFIHTHGGGEHWNTETMSKGDKDAAKDCKRALYMVDSGGCLWVYDPGEEKPKQKLVREGAPKDARWMDIKASAELQREYFSVGYYSLDEYELGYKADFFNKIHMKGLNYLKEEAVIT